VPEITVATLNLHGGMRTRRISTPRLRSRPRAGQVSRNGTYDVAAVLGALDADVVVAQESWRPDDEPAAVDVAAGVGGATVHEITFGRGIVEPWPHIIGTRQARSRGGLGIAVLSRLPTRRLGELPVGRAVGDPASNRRALHLECELEGGPLEIVAVHLSSRLPHGPPIQLARLRPQLPPPGRPAVVIGDFNLWGPAVSAMLPGWRRAVRGRTWPAHRPHSQIDHVLVRDDAEVLDAAVLDEVGSDHRPVRVTLSFP
jgi:endonuclease/exonuclease/phosphatase family metal-dependent hydrolase